jgi:cell cycle checkpoint protein
MPGIQRTRVDDGTVCNQRILVLTGPAGVGKTTTIRVLAKELGIELLEWSEGVEEWGMSGLDGRSIALGAYADAARLTKFSAIAAREGLTSKMLSFLSRNRYSSLPLNAVDSRSIAYSQRGRTSQHDSGHPPAAPRRLMLLSSLPNLSSPTTRQVFQAALLEYAQSYTPGSCPLVIIVSDTGSAGRAETSWMDRGGDGEWDVRSVIGKDLMAHPAVSVVE